MRGILGYIEETRINPPEALKLVFEGNKILSEEMLRGKKVIKEEIEL